MNADQLLMLLVQGIISGVMLAVGMIIGTRLTVKSLRKEIEDTKIVKAIYQFLSDQTLTEKATKFFEEATALVSSPEAKTFFKNVTEALKTFTKQPETMPPPSDGKPRSD